VSNQNEVASGGRAALARLYWMFVGNIVLFFLLVVLFEKGTKFPSLFDLAYGIAAGALILVRYVDIRSLHGETADGEPATMGHWKKYSLVVGLAALAAWIAAVCWRVF
jgi:hypothetical protein